MIANIIIALVIGLIIFYMMVDFPEKELYFQVFLPNGRILLPELAI